MPGLLAPQQPQGQQGQDPLIAEFEAKRKAPAGSRASAAPGADPLIAEFEQQQATSRIGSASLSEQTPHTEDDLPGTPTLRSLRPAAAPAESTGASKPVDPYAGLTMEQALEKQLHEHFAPTNDESMQAAIQPTTRLGKALYAGGSMAAHPVQTVTGLALAAPKAGYTLGQFARQEQFKAMNPTPAGTIVEPGKDVVSPRDAAFAAGQLLVPSLIGKAAPYLNSVFGQQTAEAIADAVRQGKSPTQALLIGFGKKALVGAGSGAAIGSVYSPDDPETGAILGAALGGAHAAATADKVRIPVKSTAPGEPPAASAPRLTPPKGPKPGSASVATPPPPEAAPSTPESIDETLAKHATPVPEDRDFLPNWDEQTMGPKPTRAQHEAFKQRAVETLFDLQQARAARGEDVPGIGKGAREPAEQTGLISPEQIEQRDKPAGSAPAEAGPRKFAATVNSLTDYAKEKGIPIEAAAARFRAADYTVDDDIITAAGGDPKKAAAFDDFIAQHRHAVQAAQATEDTPRPSAVKADIDQSIAANRPAGDIADHDIETISNVHDLGDLTTSVATARGMDESTAKRTIIARMRELQQTGMTPEKSRDAVEQEFAPAKPAATIKSAESSETAVQREGGTGAPGEGEAGGVRPAAVSADEGAKVEAGKSADEGAAAAPGEEDDRAKLAKRPVVAGAEGKAGETFLSSGQKVATKYRVIEAEDLQPSHNPETFAPNPVYPQGVQGREYAGKRGEAARSQVMTGALRPEVVLDRGSGTTDGPPVITHHGIVVAGNDRSMRIARASSMSPDQYFDYRKELLARADDFGVDKTQIEGMKNPVLVRQIDDKSVDVNDPAVLGELNRASDTAPTKTKDQVTAAMSRAKAMQGAHGALGHLAETMDPSSTVRDYLGTSEGRDFVRELVSDGVIASQELPAFVDRATNTVHAEGKQKLEDMLYAAAIGDADVMSRAPASVLKKIGPAVPAIVSSNQVPGYALDKVLQGALDIHAGAAAMRSEAGSGKRSIADFLGQGDMFGRQHDPEAAALALFLESHTAPQVTKELREYAKLAGHAQRATGNEDMFKYEPETPQSARQRLFKPGEKDRGVAEPSPALDASQEDLFTKQGDLFQKALDDPKGPEARAFDRGEAEKAYGDLDKRKAVATEMAPVLKQFQSPEERAKQVAAAPPITVSIVGADASDPYTLLAAAKVLRHPQAEHFSYVLRDRGTGKVLEHVISTSGMLNWSMVPFEQIAKQIVERVTALGGPEKVDAIAVHNHPAGKVESSSADRMGTRLLHGLLKREGVSLAGHLITDHNAGNWMTVSEDPEVGRSVQENPIVIHGAHDDAPWKTGTQLGQKNVTRETLIDVVKRSIDPKKITVFHLDNQRQVVAATTLPFEGSWIGLGKRVLAERTSMGTREVVLAVPREGAQTVANDAKASRRTGSQGTPGDETALRESAWGHYVLDVIKVTPNGTQTPDAESLVNTGTYAGPDDEWKAEFERHQPLGAGVKPGSETGLSPADRRDAGVQPTGVGEPDLFGNETPEEKRERLNKPIDYTKAISAEEMAQRSARGETKKAVEGITGEEPLATSKDERQLPLLEKAPTYDKRMSANSEGRPIAPDKQSLANFRKWFGRSQVVDENGRPLVLYHGTTADFDRFERAKGNAESDFGRGFYFTNTPQDVAANYAGLGPDLQAKLERRTESLMAETAEEVGHSGPEYNEAYEAAKKEAARQLGVEHEGATMPVYLKMEKPVVLGGDHETKFDYSSGYNEEIDDYDEPSGALVDFIHALKQEASRHEDGDVDSLVQELEQLGMDWERVPASKIMEAIKADDHFGYHMDPDTGDLSSNEIVRAALERVGFDGIIDHTVDVKFGSQRRIGRSMEGMHEGTVHYIAFDPTQIKSAIGNRGTFDPNDVSIVHEPPPPYGGPPAGTPPTAPTPPSPMAQPSTPKRLRAALSEAVTDPTARIRDEHPELSQALSSANAMSPSEAGIFARALGERALAGLTAEQQQQFGRRLTLDNIEAAITQNADAATAKRARATALDNVGKTMPARAAQDYFLQAERLRDEADEHDETVRRLMPEAGKIRALIPSAIEKAPWFKAALKKHLDLVQPFGEEAASKAGVNPASFRQPSLGAYQRLIPADRLSEPLIKKAQSIAANEEGATTPRKGLTRALIGQKHGVTASSPVGVESPKQGPVDLTRETPPPAVASNLGAKRSGSANRVTGGRNYSTDYLDNVAYDAADKVSKAAANSVFEAVAKDAAAGKDGMYELPPDKNAPPGMRIVAFNDSKQLIEPPPASADMTASTRRFAVPPTVADALDRYRAPAPVEGAASRALSRGMGAVTRTVLTNPIIAGTHTLTIASSVGTGIPAESKTLGLSTALPIVKAGSTLVRMKGVNFDDPQTSARLRRLAFNGALRSAGGKGGGLINVGHQFLFGASGADTRARVVASEDVEAALRKAGVTPDDPRFPGLERKYVLEHVGNYVSGNQGTAVKWLQDSGIAPFIAINRAKLGVSLKSLVGSDGTIDPSAGRRLGIGLRGILGTAAAVAAASYLLSGHTPDENAPGHEGDMATGVYHLPDGSYRYYRGATADAVAQFGKGTKEVYLRRGFVDPASEAALRVLQPLVVANRGDKIHDVLRAAVNTGLGFVGPGPGMIFGLATGKSTYLDPDGNFASTETPQLPGVRDLGLRDRLLAAMRNANAGAALAIPPQGDQPATTLGRPLINALSEGNPLGGEGAERHGFNAWEDATISAIYRAKTREDREKIVEQAITEAEAAGFVGPRTRADLTKAMNHAGVDRSDASRTRFLTRYKGSSPKPDTSR